MKKKKLLYSKEEIIRACQVKRSDWDYFNKYQLLPPFATCEVTLSKKNSRIERKTYYYFPETIEIIKKIKEFLKDNYEMEDIQTVVWKMYPTLKKTIEKRKEKQEEEKNKQIKKKIFELYFLYSVDEEEIAETLGMEETEIKKMITEILEKKGRLSLLKEGDKPEKQKFIEFKLKHTYRLKKLWNEYERVEDPKVKLLIMREIREEEKMFLETSQNFGYSPKKKSSGKMQKPISVNVFQKFSGLKEQLGEMQPTEQSVMDLKKKYLKSKFDEKDVIDGEQIGNGTD